jgi:hypothetical protein
LGSSEVIGLAVLSEVFAAMLCDALALLRAVLPELPLLTTSPSTVKKTRPDIAARPSIPKKPMALLGGLDA